MKKERYKYEGKADGRHDSEGKRMKDVGIVCTRKRRDVGKSNGVGTTAQEGKGWKMVRKRRLRRKEGRLRGKDRRRGGGGREGGGKARRKNTGGRR